MPEANQPEMQVSQDRKLQILSHHFLARSGCKLIVYLWNVLESTTQSLQFYFDSLIKRNHRILEVDLHSNKAMIGVMDMDGKRLASQKLRGDQPLELELRWVSRSLEKVW